MGMILVEYNLEKRIKDTHRYTVCDLYCFNNYIRDIFVSQFIFILEIFLKCKKRRTYTAIHKIPHFFLIIWYAFVYRNSKNIARIKINFATQNKGTINFHFSAFCWIISHMKATFLFSNVQGYQRAYIHLTNHITS